MIVAVPSTLLIALMGPLQLGFDMKIGQSVLSKMTHRVNCAPGLSRALAMDPLICTFLNQVQEVTMVAHKTPDQVFLADVSTSLYSISCAPRYTACSF